MLKTKRQKVINYGTYSKEAVDYPDFGHLVAIDVSENKADYGIVICRSGNGITMTVNKHPKVRFGLCWTKEIAFLVPSHTLMLILLVFWHVLYPFINQ